MLRLSEAHLDSNVLFYSGVCMCFLKALAAFGIQHSHMQGRQF